MLTIKQPIKRPLTQDIEAVDPEYYSNLAR